MKNTRDHLHFWKLHPKFYTCAKFQSHSKFPQKYQFFGILPVFRKNIGTYECFSETYAQRCLSMQSFIRKFLQKYRFFDIVPVFWKNWQKFWYDIWIIRPKLPYPWKFQGNRLIFQFKPQTCADPKHEQVESASNVFWTGMCMRDCKKIIYLQKFPCGTILMTVWLNFS